MSDEKEITTIFDAPGEDEQEPTDAHMGDGYEGGADE